MNPESPKTRGYIFREVRKSLPAYLDREALVQELWLKAVRSGIIPAKTLIYHRCLNELIKNSRYRKALSNWGATQREGQHLSEKALSNHKETINTLMATTTLTPQQRRIIFARFYQSETLRVIAQKEEVSINTIQERLTSALKTLRTEYRP
tara:strand:- start:745 stop:1197 length:453 start_codon:yes stop_codon:yes gene_type:complete